MRVRAICLSVLERTETINKKTPGERLALLVACNAILPGGSAKLWSLGRRDTCISLTASNRLPLVNCCLRSLQRTLPFGRSGANYVLRAYRTSAATAEGPVVAKSLCGLVFRKLR
jgi:hypothetical protein